MRLQGTVSVNSSDPPCIEGNARFSLVPLESLCCSSSTEICVCKLIHTRVNKAANSSVRYIQTELNI